MILTSCPQAPAARGLPLTQVFPYLWVRVLGRSRLALWPMPLVALGPTRPPFFPVLLLLLGLFPVICPILQATLLLCPYPPTARGLPLTQVAPHLLEMGTISRLASGLLHVGAPM